MSVGPLTQARYIVDEYRQWSSYTFTGPLMTYEIRDESVDPSAWDQNLGLRRTDGGAKPALAALRALVVH
jgi:hypothetical protein